MVQGSIFGVNPGSIRIDVEVAEEFATCCGVNLAGSAVGVWVGFSFHGAGRDSAAGAEKGEVGLIEDLSFLSCQVRAQQDRAPIEACPYRALTVAFQ
jgi:hypothetical protein